MVISVFPCRVGDKWLVVALDDQGRLFANSLPSDDLQGSVGRIAQSLRRRGIGNFEVASANLKAKSVACAILQGDDFEIALDGLSPLAASVLMRVRKIPKGTVASYRDIASELGNPGLARFVGNLMSRNPFPFAVPCHRVIRSDMSLGGFSYGEDEKRRLLSAEGVEIANGRVRARHRLVRGT